MESDSPNSENSDSLFVWDQSSQLYFHASSGFYHDPNAGWYYSSRDGLYYKFEDGNYVLLDSIKSDECEMSQSEETGTGNSIGNELCEKRVNDTENGSFLHGDESEIDANQCEGIGKDKPNSGNMECRRSHSPENPPPPSEWLEDTLIDLYLSGYSNKEVHDGADKTTSSKANEVEMLEFQADGDNDTYELEEGEWIPDDPHDITHSSEHISAEGASWEEENWRAQYGQVIQSSEEPIPEVPTVDLWDWSMVQGSRKDGKGETAKLVGRLMRKSAKLHPSMPSGGGLLRTAPICEVHHNLVRVKSGQIYRLQNPSARFLASLSAYDSSNPTKDWGFPELSFHEQSLPLSKSRGKADSKTACEDLVGSDLPPSEYRLPSFEKNSYRDRAAERRALHGSFGVAPGQKNSMVGHNDCSSSSVSASTEEAAAEALNISFGAGSYAQKILKNMGWKEGEALGKTTKGLIEPLQAEGNIGNAGLGWPRGRSRH